MFRQIHIKELPTWVDILSESGKGAEEILADLTLIDDLLVLQKIKSLLLRKKNLSLQLDNRIGIELGQSFKNTN
jgi:hypothetical protein